MGIFFNKKTFIDCNAFGGSRVGAESDAVERGGMVRPQTKFGGGGDTRRLQGFYLVLSLYVYSYINYVFVRWVVLLKQPLLKQMLQTCTLIHRVNT